MHANLKTCFHSSHESALKGTVVRATTLIQILRCREILFILRPFTGEVEMSGFDSS